VRGELLAATLPLIVVGTRDLVEELSACCDSPADIHRRPVAPEERTRQERAGRP
jgi:hypothetical protein